MTQRAGPLVVLLTDFGERDGYAGVLQGVLRQHCPQVACVTLANAIPRQDVRAAAFVLWNSYRFFPPQAVFLCVVDPGVGTARRVLAVATPLGQRFVAPDNGLLGYLLGDEPQAVCVDATAPPLPLPPRSATFHGRDLLAPIAAALAAGMPVQALGPALPRAPLAEQIRCLPCATNGAQPARILHIDGFGNVITNIPLSVTPARVRIGARSITRRAATYAAAPARSLALIPGSSGFWELALRNGSAAARLRARAGAAIAWHATALTP